MYTSVSLRGTDDGGGTIAWLYGRPIWESVHYVLKLITKNKRDVNVTCQYLIDFKL